MTSEDVLWRSVGTGVWWEWTGSESNRPVTGYPVQCYLNFRAFSAYIGPKHRPKLKLVCWTLTASYLSYSNLRRKEALFFSLFFPVCLIFFIPKYLISIPSQQIGTKLVMGFYFNSLNFFLVVLLFFNFFSSAIAIFLLFHLNIYTFTMPFYCLIIVFFIMFVVNEKN